MNSITSSRDHLAEIRRTLYLALPVVIGNVTGFGMNFVDTVMAGRLDNEEIALAALGTGGALWSAVLMFVLGTLMAVQPSVAQLDGAGQKIRAGALTRQAVWVAIVLTALFWFTLRSGEPLLNLFGVDQNIVPTAVGYLKALSWGSPAITLILVLRFFSEGTGNTKPTMYIGILGVLINIPFNYVIMYGKYGFPALGAVGCGYATSLVFVLQLLLLLAYMGRGQHYKPYKLFQRIERPNWPELRALLRVGLPIAVMIFVEGSLFVGAALLIGRLGPVPAAAHLVAINFAAMTFMVPLGIATAVTVRVGNAMGRGEPRAARYAGVSGLAIVLAFASLSSTIMLVFPDAIVRLYTDEPAVSSVAVQLLFLAAIFQFSDGIQVGAAGGLRGLKDTTVPMFYAVVAYWLIGMTVGYQLTFTYELGPRGMWMGMIAGLTVGAIMFGARFWRSATRHIAIKEASESAA